MPYNPPEEFNIADHFLSARLREGKGGNIAIQTPSRSWSYQEIHDLSGQFAHLLLELGIQPEQRVLIALPDSAEFVAAVFGTLAIGAVVAMVNPDLKAEAIEYFYHYTRAPVVITHADTAQEFKQAAPQAPLLREQLIVGTPDFTDTLARQNTNLPLFASHRDDAAIWLFTGGTTGKPKAAVQTHTSFANTTVCYGHDLLNMTDKDITLSVPKLFFGYALGSNLLFPFSVGATSILFPDRCTPERLFGLIEAFKPTVLINVPTMIKKLLDHAQVNSPDLSSLRLATSAGEALPAELHKQWNQTFGVELLDGLGTAEMWHVFVSNRPGRVKPGTMGQAVPGFEVKVCDDDGNTLPDNQVGWLWVRGNSRAIGYWQQMEKTSWGFRGDWYVTGDMASEDSQGYFTYQGRADDMLKVSGKWLAIREVEDCLNKHPRVKDVAVIGVVDESGLTKPQAYVVAEDPSEASDASHTSEALANDLQDWVKKHLEPYKYPRKIVFMDELPMTHLGKVNRGALREI